MNSRDADDCIAAFVPLRNGNPLVRFVGKNNNDTVDSMDPTQRRFVIAIHSNKMQSIGRLDILRSVWNSCLHDNSTTCPQQLRCECPVCKV
jgi:hypothetical protein